MLVYKSFFVVKDTKSKLFLNKRILYGYNYFNQTIYQIKFDKFAENAKRFSSYEEAFRFLDMLSPTEFVINIPITENKAVIKFANLTVNKILFVV